MIKVFLIHGFEGTPNGGWRPWLMAELEKMNVYACALPMPTPHDPYPVQWVEEIERNVLANKQDRIYLVGHSLGVPAILRFLEDTPTKNVKGIVLVSGPVFKTDKKRVNRFFETDFDFEKIRSKIKHCVVIHGTNDRMVSFKQGEYLAEKLHAQLVPIEKGGHLNGSSGYLQLPAAHDAIKDML